MAKYDSRLEELKQLHRKSKSARSKVEADWYMNVAYYVGDQWIMWNRGRIDRPRLEDWRVMFVDNRILPTVVSRVARKTKNRPAFVATPAGADESDMNATAITEKVLENDWKGLNLDQKHLMAQFWSEICCAGFWKIFWDKTKGDQASFLYGPEGAIKANKKPLRVDDAQENGMYDVLKEQMGDSLTEKKVGLGDISVEVISPFEIFPDPLATSLEECEWVIEEKVRSKEYVRETYGVDPKEDADAPVGIVESRLFPSGLSADSGGTTEYKGCKVYEYFCRPNSEHKNGKWCAWVGDDIVEEQDAVNSPYHEFPYVMFGSNTVPGRFWPTSVTTQLRGPQTDLNKLQSQIRENAIRIGNPSMLRSKQAKVQYSGLPGEDVLYDDTYQNAKPEYLQPPEIPVYVREEVDRIQNSFVEISGLHEVSNAQVPAGITAASAINLLQEADDNRLGPEIQLMEASLAQAGMKIIKLRAKFMSDERTARLAGEDGDWDIFSYKSAILDDVMNVDVQAGSSMPRSKAAKQAAMQELLGLILQYGVQVDPRAMRKFLRDYELGGIDRLFQDIQSDETQINREHRQLYKGEPLLINDFDDDDLHIAGHGDELKSARFARQPDNIKTNFIAHWKMHKLRRMAAVEEQINQQPEPPPEDTSANQ